MRLGRPIDRVGFRNLVQVQIDQLDGRSLDHEFARDPFGHDPVRVFDAREGEIAAAFRHEHLAEDVDLAQFGSARARGLEESRVRLAGEVTEHTLDCLWRVHLVRFGLR